MSALQGGFAKWYIPGANGVAGVGYQMTTYIAGSLTKQDTYSDQAGMVPNTNPIIMDARGEATVYFKAALYKLSLTDALGNPVWTVDNYVPQNADLAAITHAAVAKTALVAADEVAIADSAAAYVLKKITWANIKASLWTLVNTITTVGDQWIISSDQSKFRTGSCSVASGDMYNLLGNAPGAESMFYETHNFPITTAGNWGVRDETGVGQMRVWTEAGSEILYAVASGTVGVAPVAGDFTIIWIKDLTTGATTHAGLQTFTAGIRASRGINVTSAAALTLGTDGNSFNVQAGAVTNITSIATLGATATGAAKGLAPIITLSFGKGVGALLSYTAGATVTNLTFPTAGTGYEVGDILYPTGVWSTIPKLRVTSIGANGAITGMNIDNAGAGGNGGNTVSSVAAGYYPITIAANSTAPNRIITPGNQNLTTYGGLELTFVEESASNYRLIYSNDSILGGLTSTYAAYSSSKSTGSISVSPEAYWPMSVPLTLSYIAPTTGRYLISFAAECYSSTNSDYVSMRIFETKYAASEVSMVQNWTQLGAGGGSQGATFAVVNLVAKTTYSFEIMVSIQLSGTRTLTVIGQALRTGGWIISRMA